MNFLCARTRKMERKGKEKKSLVVEKTTVRNGKNKSITVYPFLHPLVAPFRSESYYPSLTIGPRPREQR